ncbi:MAG: VCBS repeat-containing protein [Verrucomicrobiae bacterium]|nr:VCBS repeat-containing protein [Verrucomicrobiae bacterium]
MASTTVAGVVAALGLSSWIAAGETVVKPLSPSGSGTPVGFTELAGPAVGIDFRNLLPDEALIQNINLANGSGVAAGDFDGDGRCDLYFCAVDGTNTLYRNLGDWRFEDCTAESGLTQPYPHCTGAVFADLNGDAALDLLVSSLGGGVHSYLNDGTGRFRETTAEAGLSSTHGSTTMALGDVDGDGDPDVVSANRDGDDLTIFRGGR